MNETRLEELRTEHKTLGERLAQLEQTSLNIRTRMIEIQGILKEAQSWQKDTQPKPSSKQKSEKA